MQLKITKNNLFILSLALPIIILLGMTTKPLFATFMGEEIKLQTVPYDPRDLFYGDYVDLRFDVEEVPIEIVEKSLHKHLDIEGNSYKDYRDVKVYIRLKLDETTGSHKAWEVVKDKPETGMYIKGVMHPWVNMTDGKRIVQINIPLERYYLEENTGKQLEDKAREGKLLATVKLYNGYAILQSVEVSQ